MNKIYKSLPVVGKRIMPLCANYCAKQALLFLQFALLLSSINPLFATERHSFKEAFNGVLPNSVGQVLSMPSDGKAVSFALTNCAAANEFTDDGYPLYKDELNKPRKDTLTICPQTKEQTIKVTFSEFDLSSGDILSVYDGDLAAMRNGTAPFIDSATGHGASAAFGAWVQASCDPSLNRSGCLTFQFKTNGDYNKGTGWTAQATCEDRNIKIRAPNIVSRVWCGEYFDVLTIGGVNVTTDCGPIKDDVLVEVNSNNGQSCINTIVSKSKGITTTQTFAIGSYVINYTLKSDPNQTFSTVFSVGDPNLVCNDRVNVSLGSACGANIEPDMLTESTCDPIPGIMYYDIVIKNPAGKVIARGGKDGSYPYIDRDQIDFCGGSVYTAEITRIYFDGYRPSYCNSGVQRFKCVTELYFEDKTAPAFAAGGTTDVIYNCDVDLSDEGLRKFRPSIIDNCAYKEATFYGATEINAVDACDKKYLIIWKAEDQCGNVSYLERKLEVRRPSLDQIVLVPDAFLSCGEDQPEAVDDITKTGSIGLKVGYKANNGVFQVTDTLALSTTKAVCNYILTKTDQSFPSTCGGKTIRTWQLLDWCNSAAGVKQLQTQVIKFVDKLAPTIQCTPHASLATAEYITLPAYDCTTKPNFPTPAVTDNCDPDVGIAMFTVERKNDQGKWIKMANNFGQSNGIGVGTYRAGWRAFDVCPDQIKEDTCYRYFILADKTAPNAICKDQLNISIGNSIGRINAADVDGGSTDACGIKQLYIRRSDCTNPNNWAGNKNQYLADKFDYQLDPHGWAEHVPIECCDIHQTVKLELLVVDKKDNYNFCHVNIIPEDKLSPVCTSLPSQTHFCDELHSGELGINTDKNGNSAYDYDEWLSLEGDLLDYYNTTYGNPLTSCSDNLDCNNLELEQQYQLLDLNCGKLSIKRRYRSLDWQGNGSNWGEQSITVNYRANWSITFPEDWIGSCGSMIPDSDIDIVSGACDNIAYEVSEQLFQTTPGACFKVVRTFTVVNWCRFNPSDAVYEVTRKESANGMVTNKQTINSINWGDKSSFTYSQILEVRDTEVPVVYIEDVEECITGAGCDDMKTFAATGTDCNEASTEGLVFNWEIFENNSSKGIGTGESFQWTVQANLPYRVKWFVFDQCGNSSWKDQNYTFKDCKAPTPYCIDGLAISLMEDASVAVWGQDFDVGSFDNCTPKGDLEILLFHDNTAPRPANLSEIRQLSTGVTFNCAYVGTQEVSMYVIDQAGNWDFCTTTVNIQDNQLVCDYGQVAGRILLKDGTAVENAQIYIEGQGEMPTPYMTNVSGNYDFNLDMGGTYTIRPFKDINPLNGISTLDLVQITKHILGMELFNSPYQHIAGDANKSNTVTAYDVVLLRQLILGISDDLPATNTSWRFVPADFEFYTDNPLQELFPEHIVINSLPGVLNNLNFVAIKVGDVSGNAIANALVSATPRSKETFKLTIKDQQVQAGDLIKVPVYANKLEEIEGYQFTLAFQGVDFLSLEEGIATNNNFDLSHSDRGYITSSWNTLPSQLLRTSSTSDTYTPKEASEKALFQLTFKAKQTGSLHQLLEINSNVTSAEAYHTNGSVLAVVLETVPNTTLPTAFQLQQNHPNPFKESTHIRFYLPESGTVQLKVLDTQGRLLHTQNTTFGKGSNTLYFNKNLPIGTYFYQLATAFGTQTKKMIVLK